MIFHITSRAHWAIAQAAGLYRAPSLESVGFIHCSAQDQILGVANSMFHGERNLLVLCIDESKVSAQIRWEPPVHPKSSMNPATPDSALFPHVYGPLEVAAVTKIAELVEGECGFDLPADLQI